MAIYHLHASTGSRKGGQSARAKSEYICRSGRYSRDRDEVLYSTSGNMPGWAESSADYWHAADLYERANGVLFREIEFALPRELSLAEQQQLADEFARDLTAGECLPYTLAIHRGRGENPHCHLMLSERRNDGVERTDKTWFKRYNAQKPERGGAQKADISSRRRTWLADTRRAWSTQANAALASAGHAARIDHRSHAERGIETIPQIHLGANVVAMERRGIKAERGERHRHIRRANAAIVDFQRALERIQAERAELEAEQQREERVAAAIQADPVAAMRRYRDAWQEHRDNVTTQAERLLSRCEQQRQQIAVSLAAERASEPEAPNGIGAVFKKRRFDAEHAAWRERIDTLESRAALLESRAERLRDYADERRRWGQAPSAGDQLADDRLAAVQPELIEARDIAEPLVREQQRQQAAQELEKRIEKRQELDTWKERQQPAVEHVPAKQQREHMPESLRAIAEPAARHLSTAGSDVSDHDRHAEEETKLPQHGKRVRRHDGPE